MGATAFWTSLRSQNGGTSASKTETCVVPSLPSIQRRVGPPAVGGPNWQTRSRMTWKTQISGNIAGCTRLALLQLLKLFLRRDQDRKVGVGVFPEREEILVRLTRLRRVALN